MRERLPGKRSIERLSRGGVSQLGRSLVACPGAEMHRDDMENASSLRVEENIASFREREAARLHGVFLVVVAAECHDAVARGECGCERGAAPLVHNQLRRVCQVASLEARAQEPSARTPWLCERAGDRNHK